MSTVNIQTLSAAQDLGRINELLGRSLNRLSSGLRITDPASDPAGVGSISKLDAQHKRTQAAATNVQNASSYVQSSVGFLASMGGLLNRMSELTQNATDAVKSAGDIALYQTEFKQLQDQLRQTIGGTTAEIGGTVDVSNPLGTYSGLPLYGANPAGLTVASGSHAGDVITIPETNLRTGPMLDLIKQDASGNYTLSVTDAGGTQKITDAIGVIADKHSILGGVDSRLELAANSLTVESQNISSAVSRIEDVDVAQESTQLTKFNLLLQSGAAMLSQANQSPQAVLQLLRG